MQAVVLVLVVAGLGWVVVSNVDGWADWVVFGVIVLTTLGAARALYERRYPTKKRTFISHTGAPRR
jgi:cobalamin biosynthesis protein CobD/CbiB